MHYSIYIYIIVILIRNQIAEFVIKSVNELIDLKTKSFLNKILENVSTTDAEVMTQYRRIVQYIIVTNYMGDPTSPAIMRETYGKKDT